MKEELTTSNLRASKVTSNEEEVDLERDENQQSMMSRGELDKSQSQPGQKNKKFLLNELKQLKDQMYQKLKFFKSRTQGKKGTKRVKDSEANQFEINGDETFEQILKHEIDHLFVMT